ncbi:hypothetical protein JQX13_06710 [Archangium violaceum]|uniref:hypothetical protein n=1 Tax=Archangium violaceum TaxID=83451 RepID=UPI00193C4C37|nr:hypothetical protein [Archangium violaceum]QRK09803.1 hypothetical protein JQX13_06710 [Archangium violaceum]
MRFVFLAVVVLCSLVGCSADKGRLRPIAAPQVLISNDGRVAAAEDGGVRLVASGDSWKNNPFDLVRYLAPVEVVLENNSGRTLRIQYGDFELVGEAHYAAFAPHTLGGLAPHAGSGPRMPSPPPTYSPYGRFNEEPRTTCYTCPPPGATRLPTEDMLRQAFPEGILKDGASWTGFLYFENPGASERQVTLQAQLVDASTGERFGTLRIPFRVHGSSR